MAKRYLLAHGRSVALLNSQQLCFLTKDQASQHCSMDGNGTSMSPPPAEELWVANGFWGRETSFP